MRTRSSTWAAGLLLLSAVLTGCATTVTGTAVAASTPPPPPAARLQAALPTQVELPANWAADGDEDTSDSDLISTVATCLGKRSTLLRQLVRQGAPDFVDPKGDVIHAIATSYISERDIDADMALLRDPGASGCLQQQLESELQSALESESATYSPGAFTLQPKGAGDPDNLVATWSGSVTITAATGQALPTQVEYVFLRGRRTEAELFFASIGTPLPVALRSSLITSMAQRLAAL